MTQHTKSFRLMLRLGLWSLWTAAIVVATVFVTTRFLPLGNGAIALNEINSGQASQYIHDYLLRNPEIINEAMIALDTKQAAALAEEQKVVVRGRGQEFFNRAEDTFIGNPDGDVTLVEFFDYNCVYCKAMLPDLMEVVRADGKVRVALKEFPILGSSSMAATRAALAALRQHRYSEFHLALLGHKGGMSDDVVMSIAKDVGLDVARLQNDMTDPAIDKTIDDNRALALALKVGGTPAMIIGDSVIPGAVPRERLTELVAAARKNAN